jgi:hypothetical protein
MVGANYAGEIALFAALCDAYEVFDAGWEAGMRT